MKESKVNEDEKVSDEIAPVLSDLMGGFLKGIVSVGVVVGIVTVLVWLWH